MIPRGTRWAGSRPLSPSTTITTGGATASGARPGKCFGGILSVFLYLPSWFPLSRTRIGYRPLATLPAGCHSSDSWSCGIAMGNISASSHMISRSMRTTPISWSYEAHGGPDLAQQPCRPGGRLSAAEDREWNSRSAGKERFFLPSTRARCHVRFGIERGFVDEYQSTADTGSAWTLVLAQGLKKQMR